VASGKEPTILAIQAQIGQGSYTTVQRYLGVWKARRSGVAVATSDMLAEIDTQGQSFVRTIWVRTLCAQAGSSDLGSTPRSLSLRYK